MKAIRKSDGKVIEVEIYMLNSRRGKYGLWESSYKDNSSGLVYEASNLDFSVEAAKEAEGEVISGWVARDMDGSVFLYQNEPDRNVYEWRAYMMHSLPESSFPFLTWDSEPMEVEITIKPKKKSI